MDLDVSRIDWPHRTIPRWPLGIMLITDGSLFPLVTLLPTRLLARTKAKRPASVLGATENWARIAMRCTLSKKPCKTLNNP